MAVKNGAYSLEEKREAVAFFNKNEVPKQIEDLLNQMFKEKPNDVFGYMVRIFFPVLFFFLSRHLRREMSVTVLFTFSFSIWQPLFIHYLKEPSNTFAIHYEKIRIHLR